MRKRIPGMRLSRKIELAAVWWSSSPPVGQAAAANSSNSSSHPRVWSSGRLEGSCCLRLKSYLEWLRKSRSSAKEITLNHLIVDVDKSNLTITKWWRAATVILISKWENSFLTKTNRPITITIIILRSLRINRHLPLRNSLSKRGKLPSCNVVTKSAWLDLKYHRIIK